MSTKPIALLLILVILFPSCSKKIASITPTAPATIAIEEIDFEYLHGKAKLHYKDDKKDKDFTAVIRIHKDSVIWMTFSVFGVVGAKALINKDSVTIMSTVDREYYVYDYAELSKRFNFTIDYNAIQSAMLGNLIQPMSGDDKVEEMTGFNQLNQETGTVVVKNYINSTTKKLTKLELMEGVTKNSLKIDYSNFQPVSEKTFPFTGIVNVFYHTPAGVLNNSIGIEYTKVEVGDKELRFPFKIPKRYERR